MEPWWPEEMAEEAVCQGHWLPGQLLKHSWLRPTLCDCVLNPGRPSEVWKILSSMEEDTHS